MTEKKKQPTHVTPSDVPPPKPGPQLIPILSAYLHEPVMLPGGQTESSLTQIKLPGIKLAWMPGEGIVVKHKNQRALIPSPNVAICYIDAPSE